MGGITSASREAMRPVVNRYQALYFYNEQYEGGVCDKFVFCTGVTPAQQLGVLVPWAVENHGEKFYTLAADYNYGHISADWVKVFLDKAGGSELGREFIPLDVVDFSSVIQRIEQNRPDVVMSLLVGGNHIAFYRQFAAAGLHTTMQIVSPTFGLGNEQVVLSPEEAEGIVVIYPYFQELDNPTNRAWVQAWHDATAPTTPTSRTRLHRLERLASLGHGGEPGWLARARGSDRGSREWSHLRLARRADQARSPEPPRRAHRAPGAGQRPAGLRDCSDFREPGAERHQGRVRSDRQPDQHTQFTPEF